MRILRALCAGTLFLIGLPFILVGSDIAINWDAQPMHVLDKSEIEVIDAAAKFVDDYFAQHGALPTVDDFKLWADHAPSSLRLDGIGFSYQLVRTPSQKEYAFSFWEGDAWVTWHSSSPDKRAAEVSLADAFFAGSKWADVSIFFAIGIAALLLAIVTILPKRQTSTH